MTTIVSGSSITFNDNTTQNTSAYGGGFAFRNRIINGDMVIDQRNNGATVSNLDGYGVDRWYGSWTDQLGRISAQRSTVAPTGFTNSWLITVTTTNASPGASDGNFVDQRIEGFNTADLAWGTASARTVTLSFWVRSSVTGTFPLVIQNSASNRAFGATYTINAANTFEYKTITIPGDTSGTWLTNNSVGIAVRFGFSGGSTRTTSTGWNSSGFVTNVTGCTNLMATNGATWYITGVQLEKGSTATSFDYRPYGTELALCQRYAYAIDGSGVTRLPGTGLASSTTNGRCNIIHPVTMRAAPNLTVTNVGNYRVYDGSVQNAPTGSSIESSTPENSLINFSGTSGLTVGRCVEIYSNSTTKLLLSSEL